MQQAHSCSVHGSPPVARVKVHLEQAVQKYDEDMVRNGLHDETSEPGATKANGVPSNATPAVK